MPVNLFGGYSPAPSTGSYRPKLPSFTRAAMTPRNAMSPLGTGEPMFGGSDDDSGPNFFGQLSELATSPLGSMIPNLIGSTLQSVFGESPEKIARRKLDRYVGKLEATRDTETKRVSQEMSQGTASAMATASNIAGRQAGALGKTEQTGSFALPAATNIAVQGGRQLRSAVSGIQSSYNRAIADAEGSMLGVPDAETWADVAGNIGDLTTQGLQQESYFQRLQKMMDARDQRLGYA